MKFHFYLRNLGFYGIVVICALMTFPLNAQENNIPSPESYFGFQMGADHKLAHWNDLVKYYNELGEKSSRLKVINMGKSTLGNTFLALYISSPDNLANLDALQRINAMLSDPRGFSKTEIEEGIKNGIAVNVQSFGLHSSEVAASQTAAEVTYDMVTRNDEEMMQMLNNTLTIIIPCFNPDGEIMVTEWYNKYVGTQYEGAGLPYLYHHYIGHDNNRDAFMLNTIESAYGAKIMFRDWVPQAYIDHHQMGAYGARLYVPPYSEPMRPDADPLVWREMAWYGAHIAYKEEEAGIAGVVNAAIYSGWGHFGFHWITPFHNIAGMLTESASATLATPLYVHPDQLNGSSRGMPKYEAQSSFPNPWEGGWWHVRNIVEQQKVAVLAAIDIAARNRETVLKNAYLKAKRQTERGAEGTVAFIIPDEQHDAITANKMVTVLLNQGIEVLQSSKQFNHEGRVYGSGTYVVPMTQPKRGVIRWLLGRTYYPDNDFTRFRDGSPIRPYDMSTDNISEYMGVRVDPVNTKVDVNLTKITAVENKWSVNKGQYGYLIDGRLNESFRAFNLLINENVEVKRVDKNGDHVRAGDFIVSPNVDPKILNKVASKTGIEFGALNENVYEENRIVNRLRIGMYQRYLGGNMDEGWTRLLLENFEFPYSSIMDNELKMGELKKKYDIIILPDDNLSTMTGENMSDYAKKRWESYPPEFRTGFGKKGVDALKEFVQVGGTLLTFGNAGELPIKEFKLPIRNVVENKSSKEFWAPGSTLKLDIDTNNHFAYGMPENGLVLFVNNNDVYQVLTSKKNHFVERIATYVDRDIMQSGWLIGEDVIANKAAMVSVKMDMGQVVLIGFRPQHRVQTHGTFKFVFNALLSRPR